MSFDARDLTAHVVPGIAGPALIACNACNTTPGGEKPQCAPPSQCQEPSEGGAEQVAMELGALDLALLRSQLRETLLRVQ